MQCPLEDCLAAPGLAELLLPVAGLLASARLVASGRSCGLMRPLLPALAKSSSKLLLLGGHAGRGPGPHQPLGGALKLDPMTGGWETVEQPPTLRLDAAVTASGCVVYVLGGRRGGDEVEGEEALAVAEALDLVHGQWQALPSLATARCKCMAAAGAGFVCVAGGYDGVEMLASVECLRLRSSSHMKAATTQAGSSDPSTWEPLPPLTVARGRASACYLQGVLYVVGGMNGRQKPVADMEQLNLRDRSVMSAAWSNCPPLLTPRAGCAAVGVAGAVYVAGGIKDEWTVLDEVERFVVATGIWEQLPTMQNPRRDFAAAALCSSVYVMGGTSYAGKCTASVERWDTTTGQNRWEAATTLPAPRSGCAAAAVSL